MRGNETYIQQFGTRTDRYIAKHLDSVPCLVGFRDYIADMSVSSIYNYVFYVVDFVEHSGKKLENLTLDDYSSYKNSIKGKTSSYQIAVYSALKKFSSYLFVTGRAKADYMQTIKRPKARESSVTKEKREKGYLTQEEVKIFLNRAKFEIRKANTTDKVLAAKRNYAILIVFLNTGMRLSGLYKLNLEDIDFESKTIVTVDKEEKVQKYSLSDDVIDVLEDYVQTVRPKFVESEADPLFFSHLKKRITQQGIYDVVKRYGTNINGKTISPHKLRATYGTLLYDKTRDIYFVQTCMGHANSQVTSLYIRGKKDEQRMQAADIMKGITF